MSVKMTGEWKMAGDGDSRVLAAMEYFKEWKEFSTECVKLNLRLMLHV